jgi:hypothetical protein
MPCCRPSAAATWSPWRRRTSGPCSSISCPLDLGEISGFRTRLQLYTVPGQVYYGATRRLVLRGADGVVFVADSQPGQREDNLESLADLQENLLDQGFDVRDLPVRHPVQQAGPPRRRAGRGDGRGAELPCVPAHPPRPSRARACSRRSAPSASWCSAACPGSSHPGRGGRDVRPRPPVHLRCLRGRLRQPAGGGRRAEGGEAPGSSYNPLFIYSGSGLGKTHLLSAIGHEVARLHGAEVHLRDGRAAHGARSAGPWRRASRTPPEPLRQGGDPPAGRRPVPGRRRQVQDELIRAWDEVTSAGAVRWCSPATGHPRTSMPSTTDCVSRLSGGLIVDMGPPDYETRVAIARRKADERGQTLPGCDPGRGAHRIHQRS